MLARTTLLWLALLIATAAAETAPACWAPSELGYRKGDERVQRGVTQARIAAPKRTLAEYSPVVPRGAIRRVQLPPGKKLVALTFDLCEQPSEISGYQGGIVDFLRTKGIKATFFIGGKWMLSHRERTQQLMADPMFEVANHTWEHRNLRLMSGQALVDEIKNAQLAYEQVREELQAKQCTGPQGNGVGPNMLSQNVWINSLKSDCNFCHQLGNRLTRSVDHVLKAKPELKSHAEAWEWRLGTGVRGTSMYAAVFCPRSIPLFMFRSLTSASLSDDEPVMLIRIPRAPSMAPASSSGDDIAACAASVARRSPLATAVPITA